MDLEVFLRLQRDLQLEMKPVGRDPGDIEDPEEKIDFIVYHKTALEAELQEALDEVGWKPWATSRHINRDAFLGELVDAFHFWMNLCLVVNASADEIGALYVAKRNKNIARQQAGYDGVSDKCGGCGRALDDTAVECHAPYTADSGNSYRGYCYVKGEVWG